MHICYFMFFLLTGCSLPVVKQCLLGQNPYRGDGVTAFVDDFEGVLPERPVFARRCEQIQNEYGEYINHGRYVEYDAYDQVRLRGTYEKGYRHGKFELFSSAHKAPIIKFYDNGIKVDALEKVADAYFQLYNNHSWK